MNKKGIMLTEPITDLETIASAKETSQLFISLDDTKKAIAFGFLKGLSMSECSGKEAV